MLVWSFWIDKQVGMPPCSDWLDVLITWIACFVSYLLSLGCDRDLSFPSEKTFDWTGIWEYDETLKISEFSFKGQVESCSLFFCIWYHIIQVPKPGTGEPHFFHIWEFSCSNPPQEGLLISWIGESGVLGADQTLNHARHRVLQDRVWEP